MGETAAKVARMLESGVPFQEAIDFLKQRLRLPESVFQSLLREMDRAARSRSVGMTEAMYRDLLGEILRSLEEGSTYAAFQEQFTQIARRHGWKGDDTEGWRSRLIFRTATASAQAAGEWRQIQRTKARNPYLEYVGIVDSRIREEHRKWDGTILHVDDPWWDTHFPPNGFQCRCGTIQHSERSLVRYKKKVSERAPELNPVIAIATIDGRRQYVTTPRGIDPGFAINVGKVGLQLPGAAGENGPDRGPENGNEGA